MKRYYSNKLVHYEQKLIFSIVLTLHNSTLMLNFPYKYFKLHVHSINFKNWDCRNQLKRLVVQSLRITAANVFKRLFSKKERPVNSKGCNCCTLQIVFNKL